MNIKLAIVQCADTGPVESLVVMLRSVGIDCALPDRALRNALQSLGCDNVTDPDELVERWGYDRIFPEAPLPLAGVADMERRDVLFVDVKAHRSRVKMLQRWPHLDGRVLWYRINGGRPEHVVNARGDHGDEVNPGCPVLTPNQWYKSTWDGKGTWDGLQSPSAYPCWPPFHRLADYRPEKRDECPRWAPPMCLVHNVGGWGFGGAILKSFREQLGVRVHGVSSPDGLINHREVPTRLSSALAYVHMKSSDAPGYALYEALAAGCPVVVSRKLIWKNAMQELLVPGETCLAFDRETHDGFSAQDVVECTAAVREHLDQLAVRDYNRAVGLAGRRRLMDLMWSSERARDVDTLRDFMARNFR